VLCLNYTIVTLRFKDNITVLYGLNLGGAKGVQSVFEHLNKELSITMQLAGTKNIEEIKHTSLID
ncbi:MAG: alpha-hydroxy-acid oxidizing protein, partial [Lactococcus lactis]